MPKIEAAAPETPAAAAPSRAWRQAGQAAQQNLMDPALRDAQLRGAGATQGPNDLSPDGAPSAHRTLGNLVGSFGLK